MQLIHWINIKVIFHIETVEIHKVIWSTYYDSLWTRSILILYAGTGLYIQLAIATKMISGHLVTIAMTDFLILSTIFQNF